MENAEEKKLIEGLKQGDDRAYKLLYLKYYKLLCFIANDFVEDHYIAETLVSDLIYSLWENRESLSVQQTLHAYLVKAIRHRSLNYIEHRDKLYNLKQSVNQMMESKQAAYELQDYYPLYTLLEKELESKIEQSMQALPENSRTIFLLSRDEGLKYEEISKRMQLSVDSVKYHIKSALSKLRADLKDYLTIWLIFTLASMKTELLFTLF